jgi:hypothetical protein
MTLDLAVREARRIRRNLVRLRRDTDLGGDCGLASLLLADALGSPASLRGIKDTCPVPCMPHVWNVIDGVIVDITATQFNDSFACDDAGEPPVFGVLVTKKPRLYHRPVQFRGRQVLNYLLREGWYEDQAYRRLHTAMKRLRKS